MLTNSVFYHYLAEKKTGSDVFLSLWCHFYSFMSKSLSLQTNMQNWELKRADENGFKQPLTASSAMIRRSVLRWFPAQCVSLVQIFVSLRLELWRTWNHSSWLDKYWTDEGYVSVLDVTAWTEETGQNVMKKRLKCSTNASLTNLIFAFYLDISIGTTAVVQMLIFPKRVLFKKVRT